MLEEGEGDWMRIGNVGKGQGAGKCNEAQRGSKRLKEAQVQTRSQVEERRHG